MAEETARIAQEQVKDVLEKLPSVGNSVIHGARYYEMLVEPYLDKMFEYKVSESSYKS